MQSQGKAIEIHSYNMNGRDRSSSRFKGWNARVHSFIPSIACLDSAPLNNYFLGESYSCNKLDDEPSTILFLFLFLFFLNLDQVRFKRWENVESLNDQYVDKRENVESLKDQYVDKKAKIQTEPN